MHASSAAGFVNAGMPVLKGIQSINQSINQSIRIVYLSLGEIVSLKLLLVSIEVQKNKNEIEQKEKYNIGEQQEE